MPIQKVSLVVPLDGGIDQSIDGFTVGASDKVATNISFDKAGVAQSGFVFEKVAQLGDEDAAVHSVVESNGVPISVGYNGFVRMDSGVEVDSKVAPSVSVDQVTVIPRDRWAGNAHSATIQGIDGPVHATVYSAHTTKKVFLRIQVGDSLPMTDVELAGPSGEVFENGRVVAVQDADIWPTQREGKVFVVIGGKSTGLHWKTYSAATGELLNEASFAGSAVSNKQMQVVSRGNQAYVVALSSGNWSSFRLTWTAPGTATTTTNALSSVIGAGRWPLQIHSGTYSGNDTLFIATSEGLIVRSRVGTPDIASYDIGINTFNLGCISVIGTKIVAILSRFERVGGLTSQSNTRPIFGDLGHFGVPPGTPSNYEKRLISLLLFINMSDMSVSASYSFAGGAPVSSMFDHPLGDGTRKCVVLNTAFPYASPDIRSGTTQSIVHSTTANIERIAPDVTQITYPGTPAPTSADPYGDGEPSTYGGPATTVKVRPAGKIIYGSITQTVSPLRVNLGPIGNALLRDAPIVGPIAEEAITGIQKQRTLERFPDITMMLWSLTGSSIQERQAQARYWGICDVATSNWYESDGRCILVELEETTEPLRLIATFPGTPYHRQLASISDVVVPPGRIDAVTATTAIGDKMMPNGFFQCGYVDDVGAFAALPSVGVDGDDICFPQISSTDPINGVDLKLILLSNAPQASNIPSLKNGSVGCSAGMVSVNSASVAIANCTPPSWISMGDAELIGNTNGALRVNVTDQRPGNNADTVVAGYFYARYRWETQDGPAFSALSPPLYIHHHGETPVFVAAAATSGYASVAPTNFYDQTQRMGKTDNSYYMRTIDTSVNPVVYNYWRRPLLVAPPLANADDVFLDIFVDPWLAQYIQTASGSSDFIGNNYPFKVTGVPTGMPTYVGTVKPSIDASKRLVVYLGVVNGAQNELASIAPTATSTVAPEALEPRPYQLPAIKSSFAFNSRAIVVGADNNVYYSKNILGAPEFSDELVIKPPTGSGQVVGATAYEDQLYLFCEDKIYRLTGNLPDEASDNLEWSVVTSGTGCISAASIAVTSAGLVYQNSAGIHAITPSGDSVFIGAKVQSDTDGQYCYGVATLAESSSIAFVLDEYTLMYHTPTQRWSKISLEEGTTILSMKSVGPSVWAATVAIDDNAGAQVPGYFSAKLTGGWTYARAMRTSAEIISTGWVTLNGSGSYQRCTRATISGNAMQAFTGACTATVRIYVNNLESADTTATFDLSQLIDAAGNWRLVVHPITQKCNTMRVEVEIEPMVQLEEGDNQYASIGVRVRPQMKYYGVNLDIARKTGSFKQIASSSKG